MSGEGVEIEEVLSKAVSIALDIKSGMDTDAFRSLVIDGIAEIEMGIEQIKDELEALKTDEAYANVWSQHGDPLNTIRENYDVLVSEPSHDNISGPDVDRAMHGLNLAVLGFDEASAAETPILMLYMNIMAKKPRPTSVVELAYIYFGKVLVARLLMGLGILSALGNDAFESWKQLIHTGKPESGDPALKKPIFAHWGAVCQTAVDDAYAKIAESLMEWPGENGTTTTTSTFLTFPDSFDEFQGPAVYVNGRAALPEGHVLIGWDLVEDQTGTYCVILWHGALDASGFVPHAQKTFQKGTARRLPVEAKYSNQRLRPVAYDVLDTSRISPPPGHVWTCP